MEIITLFPVDFASNCYILHDRKNAYVIDPSLPCDRILDKLSEYGLSLSGILLTHGHFDHIFSADKLREATGAPLYVHEDDAEMLSDSVKNAHSIFFGRAFTVSPPEALLRDGDEIMLGDEAIRVIHTPGHSKGSVCFDTGKLLITGDTIFAASFGRCDLYGGSFDTLRTSIGRLTALSELSDRVIYPGHGESADLTGALNRIKNYF